MEKCNVRLEKRQKNVVERMADNGDADTQSEAIRDAVEHYAQANGYVNGHKRDTALRHAVRRVADASALAGLMWMAFTLSFPTGYGVVALYMFLGSIVFYGVDRALGNVEPRVSNLLPGGNRA